MRQIINDWDMTDDVVTYFNNDVDLAANWMDFLSDYGDVALQKLIVPANEFAIENNLPFRVIDAIAQNEEGEIDWIIEML
jgi:hypothetical protein